MDKQLFATVSWQPILAGGAPYKDKCLYFFTRLRYKIVCLIANNITLKFGIAEMAKGRASVELFRKAKSIKASFYIAHNLAALPVAVKAAKYHLAKCGFDAEDFHRQEVSDFPLEFNYKISKFLEDKYLSSCAYISSASPLIAKAYKKLYPQLDPVVINNVFEKKFVQNQIERGDDKLKLFWFSQTIGKNRGLEDVIGALDILANDQIELHLLGNSNNDIEDYFNSLKKNSKTKILFHKPIHSEEIFRFTSKFDIGLALEPGFCYNNKIALSNKLFSYLISGLAIIASDTAAQKDFLAENEEIGCVYSIGNVAELATKIDYFFKNRIYLRACQGMAAQLAVTKYNWENESKIFINNIKLFI